MFKNEFDQCDCGLGSISLSRNEMPDYQNYLSFDKHISRPTGITNGSIKQI